MNGLDADWLAMEMPWAEWLEVHRRGYYDSLGGDDRYLDALAMVTRHGRGQHWPEVGDRPDTRGSYYAMRMDGEGHALAEMLALAKPPRLMTDSVFLEGHCNGNQFEKTPLVGDHYAALARAAGVDPKGKVYLGGLASFPGDPTAWVDSRGDVERVARAKGMNVEGAVNVKSAAREPAPDVGVADELVASAMEKRIEQEPGLAFRDQGEVRAQVREQIKPHWAA